MSFLLVMIALRRFIAFLKTFDLNLRRAPTLVGIEPWGALLRSSDGRWACPLTGPSGPVSGRRRAADYGCDCGPWPGPGLGDDPLGAHAPDCGNGSVNGSGCILSTS